MAYLYPGVTEARGMKLEKAIKPKQGGLACINTPIQRRVGLV